MAAGGGGTEEAMEVSEGENRSLAGGGGRAKERPPPCKVCGGEASGFHYGVDSCEGCKGFFRRCITQGLNNQCANEEKCEITPFSRNSCQFCRLKKCFNVGMSREGSRLGRRPKRLKYARGSSATDSAGADTNNTSNSPQSVNQAQAIPNGKTVHQTEAELNAILKMLQFTNRGQGLPNGQVMTPPEGLQKSEVTPGQTPTQPYPGMDAVMEGENKRAFEAEMMSADKNRTPHYPVDSFFTVPVSEGQRNPQELSIRLERERKAQSVGARGRRHTENDGRYDIGRDEMGKSLGKPPHYMGESQDWREGGENGCVDGGGGFNRSLSQGGVDPFNKNDMLATRRRYTASCVPTARLSAGMTGGMEDRIPEYQSIENNQTYSHMSGVNPYSGARPSSGTSLNTSSQHGGTLNPYSDTDSGMYKDSRHYHDNAYRNSNMTDTNRCENFNTNFNSEPLHGSMSSGISSLSSDSCSTGNNAGMNGYRYDDHNKGKTMSDLPRVIKKDTHFWESAVSFNDASKKQARKNMEDDDNDSDSKPSVTKRVRDLDYLSDSVQLPNGVHDAGGDPTRVNFFVKSDVNATEMGRSGSTDHCREPDSVCSGDSGRNSADGTNNLDVESEEPLSNPNFTWLSWEEQRDWLVNKCQMQLLGDREAAIKMIIREVTEAHMNTCLYTADKVQKGLEQYAEIKATASADFESDLDLNVMWQHFVNNMGHVIIRVVKFSKKLPGFSSIGMEDKINLIREGCFEVVLTRYTQLFTDNGLFVPDMTIKIPRERVIDMPLGTFFMEQYEFSEVFNRLRLTDHEIGLLTAIMMISPDRDNIADVIDIRELQLLYLQALYTVMKFGRAEAEDVDQLFRSTLDVLPILNRINSRHSSELRSMEVNSTRDSQFPPIHREVFGLDANP